MKFDLTREELGVIRDALELKVSSLERRRKALSGSLQLAYAHEVHQAEAVLAKVKKGALDEVPKTG